MECRHVRTSIPHSYRKESFYERCFSPPSWRAELLRRVLSVPGNMVEGILLDLQCLQILSAKDAVDFRQRSGHELIDVDLTQIDPIPFAVKNALRRHKAFVQAAIAGIGVESFQETLLTFSRLRVGGD